MPSSEMAPAALSITLFGPMQVLVQGQPLPRLRSRKGLWLLALLSLRANRPVQREWLAGMLWPDIDQSQAFDNLRPVLSELRRALGSQAERLQSPDRHTLVLDLTDAEVDLLGFDGAIARGTLSDLEAAVGLYRGLLLEGCNEEWVSQERTVREQNCLLALQTLGDAALSSENYPTAVGYYQRMVSLDPWQEAARRGWMEALAKNGDTNAALQVYREFVAFLSDDPHATPDEQTSALYQRLRAELRQRAGTPTPPTPASVTRTTVTRASGSPAPVAPTAVPVETAPVASPRVQGYLPHALTELVGREEECQEVAEQLRHSRLVTLTGMGGIGKTRLAREVAREVVEEYAEGVWLVALDALTEGQQVIQQVAAVLRLREEPGRTPLQSVTEHLRQKRLLLVLDNCEHLLQVSAEVAAHLLSECRQVRILATSREALGITGETVWSVPALTVPDTEHLPQGQATLLQVLMGYESVQLFVERAQAAQKTFDLTASNARAMAQTCRQLEGIPLAIELAAARTRAMTVEQIAARLNDHLALLTGGSRAGQSRQQTLRATLDWSYALLTESERLLLKRLSVFAGGCPLEAAEQVCSGGGVETGQVLDLLASLVDKSLVVFEEQAAVAGRYRLLEMVRQYAAEGLQAGGEAEQVKRKHRDWFLALAEEADAELMGANQGVWLERLEIERANLRVALDWCRIEEDGAKGLRLAGALSRFWETHGHYSEGRASLAEALARAGAGEQTNERANALLGAGRLAYYQGNHATARSMLEEGLAVFRELGNRQGVAWALNDLGDVALAQGDGDTARSLFEESLAIFRELGNRQGMASLLHHLGRVVREQGDYAQAQALYEESLAIFRQLGNRQGTAWTLYHLGNVAGVQRNHAPARSMLEEGLAIFRELGNRQGVAWALNDLGNVAIAQDNYAQAQALYEESLALFRELGNRQGMASLLHQLGTVVREQGDYAQTQALYEESLAIFRELGNQQGMAWVLNSLGSIALEQGHSIPARTLYIEAIGLMQALGDKRGTVDSLEGLAALSLSQSEMEVGVCLLGAAHRQRETIGLLAPPDSQAKLAPLTDRARAVLGEDAFTRAWEEGRARTLEQAVAYALKAGSATIEEADA